MTSFLTRTSNAFKNIQYVKLFSKVNSNSERLLLKFKLMDGKLLDVETPNIAVLLNPIKSCYYDNKSTKAILEAAGLGLIDELQEIKKVHLNEVQTSDVIITGVGSIERKNNNIKNILHVIGKNDFNENNLKQCEEVFSHYENLFLKLKEIEHKKISFPPLLELSYPYANRKCAEIFFKEFLNNLLQKFMKEKEKVTLIQPDLNLIRHDSVSNIFSVLGILFEIIKKKKITLSHLERIYYILKEQKEHYDERKKEPKEEVKVKVNQNDFYEFNMVISEENRELFEIYEKELVIFLESLNLVLYSNYTQERNNVRVNPRSVIKKYSSATNKDLIVEISQK